MLIFRDSRPAGLQIGCTIARYSGSTVIAVRAALRTLPLISMRGPEIVLSTFRAAAIAQFSAKHPNSAINSEYIHRATTATDLAKKTASSVTRAAANAAHTATQVIVARFINIEEAADLAAGAYDAAEAAIDVAASAAVQAQVAAEFLGSVAHDMRFLREGLVTFRELLETPLWYGQQPERITKDWQSLVQELRADGDHWSVWIKWYNDVLLGRACVAQNSKMPHSWAFRMTCLGSRVLRQ
jgi:hypothetical protein